MKWRYAIIMLAIALIIVLYFFANSFVGQDRYAAAEQILRLYKSDALALNQNILRTRFGFLLHYDPLRSGLRNMSILQDKLSQFVKDYKAPGIGLKDTLGEKLNIKKRLVVAFMRNNSILRNSVIYLPVAVSILTTENVAHSNLLNTLLLNVLLYTNSANEALAVKINNLVEQIPKAITYADTDTKDKLLLTNMLKHTKTILTYHPRLNTLTRQVLQVNLTDVIDSLSSLYSSERDKYIARANIYRILLFIFSLLLISIIIYMIICLRKSLRIETETNTKLNSEIDARKKAEEEVKHQNVTLETEVKNRTQTIIDTNEKLVNEITKHKKTSDFLRKAQEESKKNQHAKNVFIANLIHKITTSINTIIKNCKNNTIADDAVVNINKILDTVTDYANLEADTLNLEKTSFDFHELMTSCANKYQKLAQAKQLTFKLHLPEDCPQKLIGDHKRLNKVLENLLDNAVKYTEKGQIEVTVTYKIADPDQVILRFEIKDTGIGLNEEKRVHLLNLDDNDGDENNEDVNLNIIYCREIIKLMGGNLDIVIKDDVPGTIFCFSVGMQQGSKT